MHGALSKGLYNIKDAKYDALNGDVLECIVIPSKEDGNLQGLSEEKIAAKWSSILECDPAAHAEYKPIKLTIFSKPFTCATVLARLLREGGADSFHKIDEDIVFPTSLMSSCYVLRDEIHKAQPEASTIKVKGYTPSSRSKNEQAKLDQDNLHDRLTARILYHF